MIVKAKLSEQAEQFESDGKCYVGRRVLMEDFAPRAVNEVEQFFYVDDHRQANTTRLIQFQLSNGAGLIFVDPTILKPYPSEKIGESTK